MEKTMNATEIITRFIEGNISASDFEKELYTNPEVESKLSSFTNLPAYVKDVNLYQFAINKNFRSVSDLLALQDTLAKSLDQQGISCTPSENYRTLNSLLHTVQPRWLDITPDYFSKLLSDAPGIEGRALAAWLKNEIANRFTFIKSPPKWLQSPQWPICDDKPMVFVGQLDISALFGDRSQIYVFFDKKTNSSKTILQQT